jgi:DNA-binding protein H-NS
MKDVAIEHGFQVGDLIPILKVKPERPARYRHPTQPELTWCGRGRRPLWMSRALKEGISLSDMTV